MKKTFQKLVAGVAIKIQTVYDKIIGKMDKIPVI